MPGQHEPAEYKRNLIESWNNRRGYDNAYTERRALRLLELARVGVGQDVLDVATGTGIVALAAAGQVGPGGSVLGVDISAGMLEQGRQKLRRTPRQNVELRQGDVETLEFAAASFHAILASSSLMWLSDVPAALRNYHRWLKPGGRLAFSCYSETSFWIPLAVEVCASFGVAVPNCNEPLGSPEKCRALLGAAGFGRMSVDSEQLGGYVTLENAKKSWQADSQWIDPRGNPLADVPPARLAEMKTAFEDEIDARATEQGFCQEITIYYVTATK